MLSVQSPPISSITKISPFLIPELISEIPVRTFLYLNYEIKTKFVRVFIIKKFTICENFHAFSHDCFLGCMKLVLSSLIILTNVFLVEILNFKIEIYLNSKSTFLKKYSY